MEMPLWRLDSRGAAIVSPSTRYSMGIGQQSQLTALRVCLVFAQDCTTKSFASQNIGEGFAYP